MDAFLKCESDYVHADEHLDNDAKQKAIVRFIAESEALRMKYHPDSRLYVNNQRSVMMYLFLRYPNSNYGYKASQAKSFADCVEFYDDWGPMTDFRLDVFCRMCDQLIEEIKKSEALVATHKSRFEETDRELFPDENYHILALDIIYTSQAYNFYGDMSFAPINAKARKLHFERVAKAKELAAAVEKAKAAADLLTEANAYISSVLGNGAQVKHRAFGDGAVDGYAKGILSVFFPKVNETKKIGIAVAIGGGFLMLPSEEETAKIKEYLPVISKEEKIPQNLNNAIAELEPYLEYLD